MAQHLLSKSVLDTMRRTLYGNTAVLRLYTRSSDAAPTLAATLTNATGGWHVIRQKYQENNEGKAQPSWLHLHKSATTEAIMHVVSRCEADLNGETFRFSFDDKFPMQQLGTGWVVPLTQIDPSTA